MKTTSYIKSSLLPYVTTLVFMFITCITSAQTVNSDQTQSNNEFKGIVLDSKTRTPLAYADININGTHIGTITNNEGEFLLKVPIVYMDKNIVVSILGYEKKEINISELKKDNNKILLDVSLTELSSINVYGAKNAEALVRATLNRKNENYYNEHAVMTAFYRETIKKRNRNASLSEAIIQINKQPYYNLKNDEISLIKSRKSTDYSRLDTLAIKLQGGPFSALYTDMVKYPEYIFDINNLSQYVFSFDTSTQINNRPVYVVNFKQSINNKQPLYYGKLYIDSETLALTSAVFNLNVEDKQLSSELFVRKKPRKVIVYPTEASYRVDYRTKNGKWYYGYGNIQLTFKVNWKNKLFNSVYTLNSEMAVTDWKLNDTSAYQGEKLKPNVILTEKTSGFADPKFWGEYNIIEPEKSIENAIKKINKKLERADS
ncbi:hypothetical protein GCM10007962_19060 [Yeosuana aromativorans]|uniref:Carboxypeptidase-like regulatory domain-containing protein n=1 Tax=Yeosuana aromativorans TaxID=288019 RepID=A0A8J3BPY4_9FLAO|nr:carboxypeptidase-like regulatory domain-containing protein [Yeosuana aromativorans]GGK24987.1 hypothetical protein GCM10007962_19060 [Yeosuana aromativorans]